MDIDLMQAGLGAAAVGVLALAGAAWWRRREATPLAAAAQTPGTPADTDPLAGAMPRARFELVLQERVSAAEKKGEDCCVLHVGLDNLRFIHDAIGADAVAQAVSLVAARLRVLAGASTPIARVAAEEFALCLNASREAGEKLAARITQAFAVPVKVEGREFELGVSVGLAVAPEHGNNLRLLGKAVAATRAVQRSGGSAHATFDPRIEAQQTNELTVARDLREAIDRGRLELFYQPKIDARRLDVGAVEALLRWRHPAVGLVSPADFVPVAERQGLIEPLGHWVLDGVLKQAAVWRKLDLMFGVAVNVAGAQLRRDDFAAQLARSLKVHGVPPQALTCEIAEAVALEDTHATRQALAQLHKLGVRIAIGGFWGRPAGLNALHALPAHEIKLNRGLVAALSSGQPGACHEVQRIVAAAHERGLRVVAEGIENEAQRDQAIRLGCDELQGHLFAKPMSARAVAIWSVNSSRNLAQTLRPSSFKETLPFVA
jgi:diguanylate cyclase (GGDEF)-like protein